MEVSMSTAKRIKPISFVKSNMAEILDEINQSQTPLIITQNGEAKAVIQDLESFEKMRSALALMKLLAIGDLEDRKGLKTPQDKVFTKIEKKLENKPRTAQK